MGPPIWCFFWCYGWRWPDKLTDDLLIEILIRLPLKPANVCKSVSRRFLSLISSSDFISCYVKYHQVGNSFAAYYNVRIKMSGGPNPTFKDLIIPETLIAFGFPIFESPQRSVSFLAVLEQLKQHHYLEYVTSNNGLVLCCELQCLQPRGYSIDYFVCNPLTKQWVALPGLHTNIQTGHVGDVYVGFICKTQYSWDDDHEGADESEMGSKSSFKVVRIEAVNSKFRWQLSSTLKLEIFCSVSGRWTEEYFMSSSTSDHELFYGSAILTHRAVVCNGLLHWDGLSNRGIFTYDPYNGECRTIKLPPHVRIGSPRRCIGECCGRLRYVNFSFDDNNYRVWELKDYGNGGEWLLLHKVHLDEVKSYDQTINKNRMSMLFPHPLNQDIIFFWCKTLHQIVEYNMGNKLLQLPCILGDTSKMNDDILNVFYPFVLPCWPTAVPLIHQDDLNSTVVAKERWPWMAAMWRGVSSKLLKPASQILSSMSSSS